VTYAGDDGEEYRPWLEQRFEAPPPITVKGRQRFGRCSGAPPQLVDLGSGKKNSHPKKNSNEM
jgi:hypothetical protein